MTTIGAIVRESDKKFYRMKIELLLILYVFLMVNGNHTSNLIIDYFVYKNTSSVVLFTCNDNEDDTSLAKILNMRNIKVVFSNLDGQLKVEYFIRADYSKLGVFVDLNCYDDKIIIWLFLEASKRRWFGEMHYWLVVGLVLESILTMIEDVQFGLSTDFVVAIPTNTTVDYQLHDIYNPWKNGGGQFNVTLLGFWNLYTGLNVTLKQSKFVRRSNLRGITMKAAFFGSKYRPKNTPLDEYLQDYTTTTRDALSKFGYIILIHFSEMFNITFKFGEVEKWKPGDKIGPLSRALINNEIQITGSPVVMTLERVGLIKFVYPTWPFKTCFIFRNPQPHDIKVVEILRPLSVESWYLTIILLLILFAILGNVLRFERNELSVNRFSNAFLLVIGAMCQQGTNFTFSKVSTRILFLHVLLFSFLIYTYYSASIVSARLNEPIIKMNDSLNELAKTDLKFGAEPLIYFEFIIERVPLAEKKLFIQRWKQIPENERFLYPEKAVPLVKKGGFAYHTHPDSSYPIIDRTFTSREICELMEVYTQPAVYATIAVTYNSTILEMTKIGFAKMSEVGIRKRQLTRWSSKKPQCRNDILNVSSTDIYEFAPHLIILVIGMLAALIILCIEKAIANYACKKRIKRSAHSPILVFAEALCKVR